MRLVFRSRACQDLGDAKLNIYGDCKEALVSSIYSICPDSDDLHHRRLTSHKSCRWGGSKYESRLPSRWRSGRAWSRGALSVNHERFSLHLADLKSRYAAQWRRREFQRMSTRSML